jgi:hypothetical protein
MIDHLMYIVTWDVTVKTADTPERAEKFRIWSDEIREYCENNSTYRFEIGREGPEKCHIYSMMDPQAVGDITFEFDLKKLDSIMHHEVERLAPHIKNIFIRGASGDNVSRFMERYSWSSLADVEVFDGVDWNTQRLSEFGTLNTRIVFRGTRSAYS